MVKEKDVALVGMSCVFPRAANRKQFWANIVNAVDAIGAPPADRWRDCSNFRLPADHEAFIASNRGGYLPAEFRFDPVVYGVPPHLAAHGDPDQFIALHLIDHALRDAGVGEDDPVRARTDVILGRGGYPTDKHLEMGLRTECFETVLELMDRRFPGVLGNRRREIEDFLRSQLTPPEVENVSTAIPNLTASRAANRLNLGGAAYIVDAACASSLLAVEQAVWRLRNRQCDLAVAGGLFVTLSLRFLYVFTRLGALSSSGVLRPFDRRADGLVPGEGGGAVVLKRLDDAIRDGDAVYAVLKGVGSASDGKAVDVLAPSSGGQIAALEAAYADAGVERDTIGYLELHGTGTVAGDLAELATIKSFFGTVSKPATSRAMGSVKSMIGHTMPAAGIAALIKSALSLSNKVLGPSLHCEEPRPELVDAPFYINTHTRPWVHNPALGPRRAGVNAFGFGGVNAHVVLEEVATASFSRDPKGSADSRAPLRIAAKPATISARPIESSLHRPSELAVFSAPSIADLDRRIERLDGFLDRGHTGTSLTDVCHSLAAELDLACPVKLALVCDNLPHLRRLLRAWREGRLSSSDANGPEEVYFSPTANASPGKIAFLFPGMGFPGLIGGYPDRLMELCLHYPEVRAEFDHFEDRDRHPEDNVPTSAIFVPPPCLPEEYRRRLKSRLYPPKAEDYGSGEVAPGERYLAAMGVTLSNWVSWLLLRKFHIPVDMLTGQSQGEMAALCAAGAADFHQLAPVFWKVLNVDSRDANGGCLAFAWVSAEQVEPLIAQNPGTHVAIHIAPENVVLGGDRQGLNRIADELRRQQVFVQTLPYPPIHTPCLSNLRAELLHLLQEEQALVGKPRISLYSSITASRYPDDERLLFDTLLMNVDRPLRVWQTALQMYRDGARIFVQVGGGHMAAHMMMLPSDCPAVTVALDVEGRHPLTQLQHLLAKLLCQGVPLRLDALYENCDVRALDFDSPEPASTPSRTAVPLRFYWSPLTNSSEFRVLSSEPQQALRTQNSEPRAQMPVLGRITHRVAGQELAIDRTLDLAEDLFLHDHLFVYAPHKPVAERVPILPLTMSMEFAAEAAALLAPGLSLIGFENVRGSRWVSLYEVSTLDIRLEARLLSDDPQTGVQRIHVSLSSAETSHFSATVLLAPDYRRDVDFTLADTEGDGPWPIIAEEVYSERLMFHGPAFQSVSVLGTLGNPGATAGLIVRPSDRLFASIPDPQMLTDPCVMDGIGQVVGLWAKMYGLYILPIGADKIEFYGPPPPPGTIVPIRIEVVEVNRDAIQMLSHVELGDGQGCVLARLVGWADFIMPASDQYINATDLPHRYVWSEELSLPGTPLGSICTLLTQEHFKGVNLEWTARVFLHAQELAEYQAIDKAAQRRQFLASRAAAKDAVRLWCSRKHGESDLRHPSTFVIAHDATGRPYLKTEKGSALPELSIAHTQAGAVAIAADIPVGIDIEPATANTQAMLSSFATTAEMGLLEEWMDASPDSAGPTRLWCAKEAAAKALGTGLQGRPKDFEALAVEEDGSFLVQHGPTRERLLACTVRVGPFIVAYSAVTERMADGRLTPAGEDEDETSRLTPAVRS
ncbi:MAG TPA: beta-ketoacyl synthase N-terminal-like domain-containing protein [Gemmataceae bacterium]|nr:beta-ketoacyl synthase N-terminal-like domain-containing protein [Gemmataceae bacterium]